MEYLTRWRMLLAGDKMVNARDSISEIARSLGCESASAFTRVLGKSWAVRRGNMTVTRISIPCK
jgi:AraC-like DNA-binding protein